MDEAAPDRFPPIPVWMTQVSRSARVCPIEKAELLLVGFSGYNLSTELHAQTSINEAELKAAFNAVGSSKAIVIPS
jgi:hypothetical protein